MGKLISFYDNWFKMERVEGGSARQIVILYNERPLDKASLKWVNDSQEIWMANVTSLT